MPQAGGKALQMLGGGIHQAGGGSFLTPWGRIFGHAGNFLLANREPPWEALFRAGHAGIMKEDQMGRILALSGVGFTGENDGTLDQIPPPHRPLAQAWNRIYAATRPMGGIALIHELANREAIDLNDAYKMLQRVGFHPEKELPFVWRLRKQLPPISDLIRFAVKDVFDPAVVARLRLLDEYPVGTFDALCQAQGLTTLSGGDVHGLAGNTVSVPALYWAAHWQPLAPTQMYEMYQRLRPDRVRNFQAVAPGVAPFTFSDLMQGLKVADYPPGVRNWLAAISYRKPRLVDVLRFRQLGVTNRAETLELYKDIGYTPVDADRLTEFTEREVKRRINLGKWGASKAQLTRWKELGLLREDDLRQLLRNSGLSQEETDLAVQVILLEIDRRFLEQVIRGIRSRYYRGVANANDARNQLFGVIPDPQQADRIWQTWQAAFTETRRALSAEKIQTLARKGIIDLATANVRLANLGYSEEDRGVLLSEVVYDRAVQAARAAQAQARTAAQAQRAQAAAIQALQRSAAREQKALASRASPAQLGRWLAKGLIPPGEAQARLQALGWSQEDAGRLIAEKVNGTA